MAALVGLVIGCSPRIVLPAPPSPEEAPRLTAHIHALLDAPSEEGDARILDLLRGARDLDGVVVRVDLDRLLARLRDRRGGPQHATAFRVVLTQERLPALGVEARARVVRALRRGPTGRDDEGALAAVLLGTRGAQLGALKRAIDGAGDGRDLRALLWGDVDDEGLRRRVLAHFARQPREAGLKVVSDVDDTLVCSLHDERWPGGTTYPGAAALLRALDAGPRGDDPRGDVVLLTARPGLLAGATRARLEAMDLRGAVVTGPLLALRSHDAMARGKLEGAAALRALWPERRLVFFGDAGQGDPEVALALARLGRDAVPLAAIHDVRPLAPARRAALDAAGVVVFATWLGAARACLARDLIDATAYEAVVAAARADLAALPLDAEGRAARAAELERDHARGP